MTSSTLPPEIQLGDSILLRSLVPSTMSTSVAPLNLLDDDNNASTTLATTTSSLSTNNSGPSGATLMLGMPANVLEHNGGQPDKIILDNDMKKEWEKTVYELNKIIKGGTLYSNNGLPNGYLGPQRMPEFQLEHWMIVSILTPCVVALYLILIMIAYHTFCKRGENGHDSLNSNGQIETISGTHVEESITPPPAYALTIRSGESLYVPPSYKMIYPSYHSHSQDSYGGLPDFSCFSGVSDEDEATDLVRSRTDLNANGSFTSNSSDSRPLILTGGSITPASTPTSPTSRPLWDLRGTSLSQFDLMRHANIVDVGRDDPNIYEFDTETGGWKQIAHIRPRRGSQ